MLSLFAASTATSHNGTLTNGTSTPVETPTAKLASANVQLYKPVQRVMINSTKHRVYLLRATDTEADALEGRTKVPVVVTKAGANDVTTPGGGHKIADGQTEDTLSAKPGGAEGEKLTGLEVASSTNPCDDGPNGQIITDVENKLTFSCNGQPLGEDVILPECAEGGLCIDVLNFPEQPCDDLSIAIISSVTKAVCHTEYGFSFLQGVTTSQHPKVERVESVSNIGSIGEWAGHGGQDPHLHFADGGEADFRGVNNSVYSILSAPGISFGLRTTDTDHLLPTLRYPKLVHGSFFTGAFWTLARAADPQHAHPNNRPRVYVYMPAEGKAVFVFEAWEAEQVARFETARDQSDLPPLSEWRQLPPGHHYDDGAAVRVEVPSDGLVVVRASGWEMNVTRHPIYNCYRCGPNPTRLDFAVRPLDGTPYQAKHGKSRMEVVAPHGVMGQSWDGDELAVDGRKDDYHVTNPFWTVINTTAQLEGAIEGVAADYVLSPPFATSSKFSRYDVTSARPRDVALLTGAKHAAKRHAVAGSSEPLQPPDVDTLVRLASADKPADKSVEGA